MKAECENADDQREKNTRVEKPVVPAARCVRGKLRVVNVTHLHEDARETAAWAATGRGIWNLNRSRGVQVEETGNCV